MSRFSIDFESTVLNRPERIHITIPKKFLKYKEDGITAAKWTERDDYVVVFLLHGKSGNGFSFYEYTDLVTLSEKYNVIAIMADVGNSFYANMVYGERYFDYLSKEVPHMVESTMNFKLKPSSTYVLGYSMGGFGAVKWGLTDPDRFSGIASLSGSLRDMTTNKEKIMRNERPDLFLSFGECEGRVFKENDIYILVSKCKEQKKVIPFIYQYCGTGDGLLEVNEKFHDYLTEEEVNHVFVSDNGVHDFQDWNRQIEEYFKRITRRVDL